MNQRSTITLENVLQIQDTLSTMPVVERQTVSKQEAIRMLAPALFELQAKGYTYDEIKTLLSDRGITLSLATLKCYLHRSKQRARRARGPRRALPEAAPRLDSQVPEPVQGTPERPTDTQAIEHTAAPTKGTFVPIQDSEEI